MEIIVNLLRGVAVGLANIIPGVSGGTMALVLGIYERLLSAIGKVGPDTVKAVVGGPKAWVAEFKRVDGVFLTALVAGAGVAVVGVARLMIYLLLEQHDPTYGFFFGLVLASVVVPYRMIRNKNAGAVISCLVAIACVVGLTLAMSGEERLASAQKKAALKAAKIEATASSDPAAAAKLADQVPRDGKTMVLFFVGGAVAIAAMILPGISGSFMLLLMGIYFDVLACITGRQFVLLGILALGCVVGLLLFTRLLNWLLEHAHDLTMSYLLGLVIGSLYAIWPFKNYGMAGDKRVDMDNILPATFGTNELLTLAAALVGMAVVAGFIAVEIRQGRGKGSAEA